MSTTYSIRKEQIETEDKTQWRWQRCGGAIKMPPEDEDRDSCHCQQCPSPATMTTMVVVMMIIMNNGRVLFELP